MDFNNKVALITGSSRGIGKAIAIEFAKNNCNVIINYLKNKEEAIKVKNYIVDNYDVDDIVNCDISNEEEVKEMIEFIIKKYNKIDFLINNAGIAIDTLPEEKEVSNFNKILSTNLIGPFLVCKYAGKYMMNQKYGKIVNITSTNGIYSMYKESLDYDASKAGLINLTHNLASMYAPYINVNSVAPGWVNTDMNKNLDKDFIEKENKKILLNRFAMPNEIASVVVFLCSDLSRYINSQIICVDGGVNFNA